ncbi:MAG: hypothetical protein ACXIUQ_07075 [Cecembia sp.]
MIELIQNRLSWTSRNFWQFRCFPYSGISWDGGPGLKGRSVPARDKVPGLGTIYIPRGLKDRSLIEKVFMLIGMRSALQASDFVLSYYPRLPQAAVWVVTGQPFRPYCTVSIGLWE